MIRVSLTKHKDDYTPHLSQPATEICLVMVFGEKNKCVNSLALQEIYQEKTCDRDCIFRKQHIKPTSNCTGKYFINNLYERVRRDYL